MVDNQPNAQLNVTYGGQNGDYPDPVGFDATDGDVKQIAAEAVRTGYIPGIDADPRADFGDFVVDRFPAKGELPNRLILRPKTPFGTTASR
jgi:hypothetical protein